MTSQNTAVGIACDIRDPDSQNRLVKLTQERLGTVDILVANAGINLHVASRAGAFTTAQTWVVDGGFRMVGR
jgi:NAD(P)-dependent dehydrogenase (short-subunit alcohol dehydrogenase family)